MQKISNLVKNQIFILLIEPINQHLSTIMGAEKHMVMYFGRAQSAGKSSVIRRIYNIVQFRKR